MLDSFSILTTSGVVLWSKNYEAAPTNPAVINSLISDVFIEERIQQGTDGKFFRKDAYTLKWRTQNDLGLIFIAVYQSLLQLTWIDELLDTVKKLFVTLYGDKLRDSKKEFRSTIECHFDDYFESRVRELEGRAGGPVSRPAIVPSAPVKTNGEEAPPPPPAYPGLMKRVPTPSKGGDRDVMPPPPLPTPARTLTPNHLLSAKARPGSGRRGRNNQKNQLGGSPYISSGDEAGASGRKKPAKRLRKWTADGSMDYDDGESEGLDYSTHAATSGDGGSSDDDTPSSRLEYVDQSEWGKKTSSGEFILKDLDSEVHALLKKADSNTKKPNGSTTGITTNAFNFFSNIIGNKVLTQSDLEKPMAAMLEHLLKKNVAREAALQVCTSVETSLIGQKTASFQSVETLIKSAMESSLRKILTPTTSLDLLREIAAKKSHHSGRPYVISIVGVNGVGKSTNLSKICFFLLQNKLKVLIAACDTFRSGAVEQLRVHARNLKELSIREGGVVELYEKGYGKDAANIAKDAVSYAQQHGFDVVLIDTAGRRHNDTRLMSSLEKFAKFAEPDKILMVGEALVGTDSVSQARNFNAAFGRERGLDGFIISKCDTVGDMVGTLVSMVYATGIPVVFLGTGQNYQDLRTLSEGWAVGLLMST